MPYTGMPLTVPSDKVRMLVGDTDTASPLFTDNEINFLINEWEDSYLAAAAGAETLAANAALMVGYSADGVSLSTDQLQQKYFTLAEVLRKQYFFRHRNDGTPWAGGVDRWETEAFEVDDSVIHPDIGTGMHDNPRRGSQGGTQRSDLLGGPW